MEKDEEKNREKIRKISEALISGAKMLPIHCATCMSPLFQEGERIFCPICGDKEIPQASKILEKKLQDLLSQLETEKNHERIMKILEEIKVLKEILKK